MPCVLFKTCFGGQKGINKISFGKFNKEILRFKKRKKERKKERK